MFDSMLGFSGSADQMAQFCGSIKSKMVDDGHVGYTKMVITSQPAC